MPASPLVAPLLRWYDTEARDLPWRRSGTPPWAVLVSEVMLQQTPVVRVLPAWSAWLERWPEPADLAAVAPGEAVRMWGKLGYPRRALRLHECARVLVQRHDGAVPPTSTSCSPCPASAPTPPERSPPSPSGNVSPSSTPTSAA